MDKNCFNKISDMLKAYYTNACRNNLCDYKAKPKCIYIIGENKNVIYKSRNAQEAYTKWNVYIGRKKERPQPEHHKNNQ